MATDRIRFVFNEKKSAQSAAYLLKINGGSMDWRRLVTLMYLADREMLLRRGRTITGDEMACVPDAEMFPEIFVCGDDQRTIRAFRDAQKGG